MTPQFRERPKQPVVPRERVGVSAEVLRMRDEAALAKMQADLVTLTDKIAAKREEIELRRAEACGAGISGGFGYLLTDIIRAVCRVYNVPLVDLLSDRRTVLLVEPRQVAMYLARTLTMRSLPAIGVAMRRDHTTVLHGYRRAKARRAVDASFDARIREVEVDLERSRIGREIEG